jgi:hypothetical protein
VGAHVDSHMTGLQACCRSMTPTPVTDRRVDPVSARVIAGALESIAIEMGHKLTRMSYSGIIRECLGIAEQRRLRCECDDGCSRAGRRCRGRGLRRPPAGPVSRPFPEAVDGPGAAAHPGRGCRCSPPGPLGTAARPLGAARAGARRFRPGSRTTSSPSASWRPDRSGGSWVIVGEGVPDGPSSVRRPGRLSRLTLCFRRYSTRPSGSLAVGPRAAPATVAASVMPIAGPSSRPASTKRVWMPSARTSSTTWSGRNGAGG